MPLRQRHPIPNDILVDGDTRKRQQQGPDGKRSDQSLHHLDLAGPRGASAAALRLGNHQRRGMGRTRTRNGPTLGSRPHHALGTRAPLESSDSALKNVEKGWYREGESNPLYIQKNIYKSRTCSIPRGQNFVHGLSKSSIWSVLEFAFFATSPRLEMGSICKGDCT